MRAALAHQATAASGVTAQGTHAREGGMTKRRKARLRAARRVALCTCGHDRPAHLGGGGECSRTVTVRQRGKRAQRRHCPCGSYTRADHRLNATERIA